MSDSVAKFIDDIANLSPGLAAARADARNAWEPERLPLPVLLLAFGHRLVEDFESQGLDTDRAVLGAIARALASDDADLYAASSSIVEALVGRAVDRGIFAEIRPILPDAVAARALTFMTLDR